MIIWLEGVDYPYHARTGDILFIAGCLPPDPARRLPFEHVALVGENRVVNNHTEFLDLRIYGMPESERDGSAVGILQNTGRYWLGERWLGKRMGSKQSVWNLSLRDNIVDNETALDISYLVPILEGSFPCTYDSFFRIDSTLSHSLKTNCLGFICSVLEYVGRQLLEHTFPTYPSPYRAPNTNDRDFPSPGHLAYVLHKTPENTPWCAKDVEEAIKYSRVDVTLQEITLDLGGPCLI